MPLSDHFCETKTQNLVKTWLQSSSKEVLTDVAFLGEPLLTKLFTKFKIAIPSSAAVESLFSIGKDISTAKRATLSDINFEKLMFMKGNHHHVKTMEEEQEDKPQRMD